MTSSGFPFFFCKGWEGLVCETSKDTVSTVPNAAYLLNAQSCQAACAASLDKVSARAVSVKGSVAFASGNHPRAEV